MEALQVTRTLAVAVTLLFGVGCKTIETCKEACGMEMAAPCQGAQLVTTWNHEVVTTPDPSRGGEPTIGLAGRIYLFSPETVSIEPQGGSLVVYMYDHSAVKSGGRAKMLEEWNFDPVTLKKLMKKDAFGWGYTLFLPWGSYRPDISTVHIQCVYQPTQGEAIHSTGQPLSIDHQATKKETVVRK